MVSKLDGFNGGFVMKRLRMMRAPLKYVQGKGALLQFRKEMEYMGKR